MVSRNDGDAVSPSTRSAMRASRLTSVPRLAALVVVAWLLVVVGKTDWIAGVALLVGVTAFALVVRRPGHRVARLAVGLIVVALTASLALVSIATFDFRAQRTDQLITPSREIPGAVTVPKKGKPFEVMGFLTPDFADAAGGLDRDAPALSDVASTRLTLSTASPGHVVPLSVGTNTPLRAHVENAHAQLILSNYDGNDFNGDLAQQVLGDPSLRSSLVSDVVTNVVASSPAWDGVVIDLENLHPETRPDYLQFVNDLRAALDAPSVVSLTKGVRVSLDIAVNAETADTAEQLQPYDLASLVKVVDRVIWMAYDEHTAGTSAGPVGSLAHVRSSLELIKKSVPLNKVLLGIATYGYKWSGGTNADPVNGADMPAIRATAGAHGGWDPAAGEEHWTLPGGVDVWYSNAQSFKLRAKIAADAHLAGVAVWRLGADEATATAFAQLPVPPIKYPRQWLGNRDVQLDTGTGLVALTFDDGPDPTWTPQILDVLQRAHVPGTFFDIGREVLDNPDLARRESESGNVVGSHTYTHPNLDEIAPWRQWLELEGGQAALEGAIGRIPLLFRPPYGAGDRVGGAGQSADQMAARLGLVEVDWTDDPNDWKKGSQPDDIVNYVVSHAAANTIVLLHDGGGDRTATVTALPKIIEQLKAKGYSFTTADRLTGGLDSAYQARTGLWSKARGAMVIASFRLARTVHDLAADTVFVLAAISIGRLLLVVPLALLQMRLARRRRRGVDPDASYAVAVVIPAYNEEAVIAKSLESLLRLEGHSAPREIIVVDDGSTDATNARASQFGDRVRVIHKENGGKASALNVGIRAATSDIVVVLDADTVIVPGFIEAIGPHFNDPLVVGVAGNVRVGNRRRLLPNLQAIEYITSLNLDRRAQDTLNTIAVVPGAAGAFRRSAVLDAGGYPSDTLVEDADLTVVLLRRGGRIVYESKGLVWTEAPERVRDALKQRRRWAFGTVQVCVKHADVFLSPQAGRVGMIALPYTVLTQILLPISSPVTDFYLLWLFLTGTKVGILWIALAVALVADLLLTAVVVVGEREQLRLLLFAPLLRWVWRPIQIYAVFSASRRWARGERQRWQPSVRYDTVNAKRLTTRTTDAD